MGKWCEQLILEQLKKVCDELGYFPKHRDLMTLGRGDLRNAIILSGKKISEYADKIGEKSVTKPKDYWNKITIKEELKQICDELGYFPTRKQLIEMGHASLHNAMWRDETSIQFWQELLGYEQKRNPNGYWNDETIIKELLAFTEVYEFLPTQKSLRNNGKHDLMKAIDRSEKGLAYFQKMVGFEPPFYEATDGHFLDSSYEHTLDEWLYNHGIKHDVHGYINRNYGNYRYDFKIGDTYIEIWGYPPDSNYEMAIAYTEKRKIKEKIYTDLNLTLIGLEASFFNGSVEKVEQRISETFSKFI